MQAKSIMVKCTSPVAKLPGFISLLAARQGLQHSELLLLLPKMGATPTSPGCYEKLHLKECHHRGTVIYLEQGLNMSLSLRRGQ